MNRDCVWNSPVGQCFVPTPGTQESGSDACPVEYPQTVVSVMRYPQEMQCLMVKIADLTERERD